MNFAAILPILIASVGAQEKTFAISELTGLLSAENTRVNAGLTPDAITALVGGVVQLAFAEQTALVNKLTVKTAATK